MPPSLQSKNWSQPRAAMSISSAKSARTAQSGFNPEEAGRLGSREVNYVINKFLREEVFNYAPLIEAIRLIEEDPDLTPGDGAAARARQRPPGHAALAALPRSRSPVLDRSRRKGRWRSLPAAEFDLP